MWNYAGGSVELVVVGLEGPSIGDKNVEHAKSNLTLALARSDFKKTKPRILFP